MRTAGVRGNSFDEVRFVVADRLSVAQYARALEIDDPLFRDGRVAGDSDLDARLVPPAMLGFFLTVNSQQLVDELGFTWGKTLNAAIEVSSPRVVTERDEVTGRCTVEDAWERVARDGVVRQFLVLRADFTLRGALACRWRVTFMERKEENRDPNIPEAPQSVGDEVAIPEEAGRLSRPPDLAVGQCFDGPTVGPIDRLCMARLVVALDNPDPLHLDDEVARSAGFDRVVGPGSAVIGLLHEAARRGAGFDRVVYGSTTQRLPYTLGDVLSAVAEVTSVGEHDGREVATVHATVRRGDGEEIGAGDFAVVVD